jgi:hypothetical protein
MISLLRRNLRPDPLSIGPILVTNTIQNYVEQDDHLLGEIQSNLMRFLDGDWGDLDMDDWEENTCTINRKTPAGRLMGSYSLDNGETMWIITDGYGRQEEGPGCCYTTILSPSDY